MKNLFIAIPARNEQKNLRNCIKSIYEASNNLNYNINTFICLNGCSDNTKLIAKKCKKEFLELNISILNSKEGKLYAQKKIIEQIKNKRGYVFFTDADTELDKNSIDIMVKEMNKYKELLAVGGFPMAKKYKGSNPWEKFLDEILNIRSRHPMSEISKLNVREYHKHTLKDPQKINTSQEHEIKSKIFFHGRLFALRSAKYWRMANAKKGIVGDDSFLPDYIISVYGKNRIRIRYDAIVYFNPFISLIQHYKAYKRIYFDLKNLKKNYPEFRDIREHSVLVLDKNYIYNQELITRLKFKFFEIIRNCEKFLFNVFPEDQPSKIWSSAKR